MNLIRYQAVLSGAALAVLATFSSNAADLNPSRPPAAVADPVAEVRIHDAAFALLIESFQQLQTAMIEADFQERIFAADQLTNNARRTQVLQLARQERDLRLAKLSHQLNQMLTSYTYSRRDHERAAGRDVPANVDRDKAAEQLKGLVVFVPETTPKHDFVISKIVPMQTVAK